MGINLKIATVTSILFICKYVRINKAVSIHVYVEISGYYFEGHAP